MIIILYYIFIDRREPEDIKNIDTDRDVFNERPSKEDIMSSTEAACELTIVVLFLCNIMIKRLSYINLQS